MWNTLHNFVGPARDHEWITGRYRDLQASKAGSSVARLNHASTSSAAYDLLAEVFGEALSARCILYTRNFRTSSLGPCVGWVGRPRATSLAHCDSFGCEVLGWLRKTAEKKGLPYRSLVNEILDGGMRKAG